MKKDQSVEVKDSTSNNDDYSKSLVYSSYDTDSLLLESGELKNLIVEFKTKGQFVYEKEYGGGDCYGKFKKFLLNQDTLTIDKFSCGEYGFENTQYLTSRDTLLMVRKYKCSWNVIDSKNDVAEKIYYFKDKILKERKKTSNSWKGYFLNEIPFTTSEIVSENEYNVLKKELTELKKREVI